MLAKKITPPYKPKGFDRRGSMILEEETEGEISAAERTRLREKIEVNIKKKKKLMVK